MMHVKRQNPYNPINIYITYTLINYSLIKQTKLNIYFCSTKTVTVIQKKIEKIMRNLKEKQKESNLPRKILKIINKF